jgi:protein involved in polysaccharide export with SLBB domain
MIPQHRPAEARRIGVTHPDRDDVVVRLRAGNPHTVCVLGTVGSPDQYSLRTRQEAVKQAVAFARRHRVRAWLDAGDGTLTLLGPFGDGK